MNMLISILTILFFLAFFILPAMEILDYLDICGYKAMKKGERISFSFDTFCVLYTNNPEKWHVNKDTGYVLYLKKEENRYTPKEIPVYLFYKDRKKLKYWLKETEQQKIHLEKRKELTSLLLEIQNDLNIEVERLNEENARQLQDYTEKISALKDAEKNRALLQNLSKFE